jgi:hypothetical protein
MVRIAPSRQRHCAVTARRFVRRPTRKGCQRWLCANYSLVESEIGAAPDTDFIFGELQTALFLAIAAAGAGVDHLTAVQPPPVAVQGDSPLSGLFGYDRFSRVPRPPATTRPQFPRQGECSGSQARLGVS